MGYPQFVLPTPRTRRLDALTERRTVPFLLGSSYRDRNQDGTRAMAAHARTVLKLGDGGVHYNTICDDGTINQVR
jgi:hypothetical protein